MPVPAVDFYLRLSNASDGADSIDRQDADLRQWASREGLQVRTVWTDYGRSGFKDVQRDGFDSALRALTSGEVSTLAVWKLDRLSRRGAGQVGLVLDEVEKVGGRIYFLRDGLDTSSGSNSRLPILTLSEIARAESANTSTRVKSRKSADRRAGRYLGGSAPIGYVVDDDRRFRPHETEFSLMRELVKRVTEGESLLAVARDWNHREIPTRRNGLWRPSTLSHALRSPALAGLMTETGEKGKAANTFRDPESGETVSLIAEGFEPIATEAQQARLLAVMDGRLRTYGRGLRPARQPRSLLGALASCGSCGRSLTTFGASYRCKKSFADGSDCPGPVCVSIDALDNAVRRLWTKNLASLEPDSEVLASIADRWLRKFDPTPMRERDEVQKLIDEAEARLAKADVDHYERGSLDEDRHARVTGGLTRRLRDLRALLAELPNPRADLGALLDPELSLPAIETAPVVEARDLLALTIKKVTVTPSPRRGARFVPHERVTVTWISA